MCTLRQVTLSSNLATLQDDRRAQKDLTRRTLVKRDLDKQLLRSRHTPTVRRKIGVKGAGIRPPYAEKRSDINRYFESGIPKAVGWRRRMDFVADDLGYMN